MLGTLSLLYIQAVFAVKGRDNLINKECEEKLYQ